MEVFNLKGFNIFILTVFREQVIMLKHPNLKEIRSTVVEVFNRIYYQKMGLEMVVI